MFWKIMVMGLVSVASVTAYGFLCNNQGACECLDTAIVCQCKKREEIKIQDLFVHFQVNKILISGCGTVQLTVGSVLHMGVERFEVDDVNHLIVRPFAFTGVEYITTLQFSNIANLEINSLGLNGISNLTEIVISNVTTHNFEAASFSQLGNFHRFTMKDTTIDNVANIAFILSNVDVFEMENTRINNLQNASFLLHEVGEVLFINCTFDNLLPKSFVFISIKTLVFRDCDFGSLPMSFILSKNIDRMILQRCLVHYIEPYAMFNTDVISEFIMYENTFDVVDENSLLPNVTENLIIDVQGNKFNCTCLLSWMWAEGEDIYEKIKDTSHCTYPALRRLSSLTPQFDSRGRCLRLDYSFHRERTYGDVMHSFNVFESQISGTLRLAVPTDSFVLLMVFSFTPFIYML